MPFIKQKDKDYFIKNNKIILSNEYKQKNQWKFKKITGSRFSSIIGENEWNSELKSWAIMVGIYKDKMDDTLSVVGNVIEPKLKKYAEEILNKNYLSYSPSSINWDVFKDNVIFGGIPDGEPLNKNGDLDYPNSRMLEIKTTSIDSFYYKKIDNVLTLQKDEKNYPIIKEKNGNLKKWFINDEICVPNDYCMQLSLYLYLRKINKGIFLIGFLEQKDYVFPEMYEPKKSLIKFVEIDIDKSKFEQKIIYAKNWYLEHIKTGESPKISEKDRKWLREEGLYF